MNRMTVWGGAALCVLWTTHISASQPVDATNQALESIESQIIAAQGENRQKFIVPLTEIAEREQASTTGLRARSLLVQIHIAGDDFAAADLIITSTLVIQQVQNDIGLRSQWARLSADVAKAEYERMGPQATQQIVTKLMDRYRRIIDDMSADVFNADRAERGHIPVGYAVVTQTLNDLAQLMLSRGMHEQALALCDDSLAKLRDFRVRRNQSAISQIERQLLMSRAGALLGLSRTDEALAAVKEVDDPSERDIVALNAVMRATAAPGESRSQFGLEYLAMIPVPFSTTQMSLAMQAIDHGEPEPTLLLIERLLSADNQTGLSAYHALRVTSPSAAIRAVPRAEREFARYQLLVRQHELLRKTGLSDQADAVRQLIVGDFADSQQYLRGSGLID